MALPRKGTRSITVDGTPYRWYIGRNPTYAQALGWSQLVTAIELATPPGTKALVSLPQAHPSNWIGAPQRAVTPAIVAAGICGVLRAGWRPTERGAPFHFSFNPSAGWA